MRSGEVWLVALEPTVGAEIGKTRPGVIVSRDTVGILPLTVIVPITRWQERYKDRDWMVRLEPTTENGLAKLSAADTLQIRSVAKQRLLKKLGTLSTKEMQYIIIALTTLLNIDLD